MSTTASPGLIVSRSVRASLALLTLLALAGCASERSTAAVEHASAADSGTASSRVPVITLDGDFSDWPASTPPNPVGYTVAAADEHHLYMRFTVEGEQYTIQSAPWTTAILLDVDADASTGKPGADELQGLGIDLAVEFSPRRPDRETGAMQIGRGVRVIAMDASGRETPLEAYDWDVSFAPTFASDWYEARISRTPAGNVPVPTSGLLSAGTARGAFVTYDASGVMTATSEIFTVGLEDRCLDSARLSNVDLPAKDPGSVRVVSYNVLRTKPNQDPATFARIFSALDPDIILVQEWEVESARQLAEWFNANLMREGGWDAVTTKGTVATGAGVGIVSKFAASTENVSLLVGENPEDARYADDPVRYALGRIDTPMGPILASSVHLKAAGSASSWEDRKRIAEAAAIRADLRAAIARAKPAMLIIGGDINLVGSRFPLEGLANDTDIDGSDIAWANPRTLGDRTYATWSEYGNTFSPGRLDWIGYSDSKARVVRSFVLDTSRLSDESLAKAGLQRDDTAQASDHKPVVVDIAPAR
jgi:endonuclease/exonuclease/phosphatase family metal-dependent hydrolase